MFDLRESPPRGRSGTPPPRLRPATSLRLALQKRSAPLVQRALERDMLAVSDHSCEPALLTAIRCDCSVEILRLLLEHGADANYPDNAGETPLSALANAPVKEQPGPRNDSGLRAAQRLVRGIAAGDQSSSAVALSDARCCEMAALLLAHGANDLQACGNATSAADAAERKGRHGLAGLIRSWSSIQQVFGLWGSSVPQKAVGHPLSKQTPLQVSEGRNDQAQGA